MDLCMQIGHCPCELMKFVCSASVVEVRPPFPPSISGKTLPVRFVKPFSFVGVITPCVIFCHTLQTFCLGNQERSNSRVFPINLVLNQGDIAAYSQMDFICTSWEDF